LLDCAPRSKSLPNVSAIAAKPGCSAAVWWCSRRCSQGVRSMGIAVYVWDLLVWVGVYA
jgi:hypothetical protein